MGWRLTMSEDKKDSVKIDDLRDTDIDAENRAKIEAMNALLKNAPKGPGMNP